MPKQSKKQQPLCDQNRHAHANTHCRSCDVALTPKEWMWINLCTKCKTEIVQTAHGLGQQIGE